MGAATEYRKKHWVLALDADLTTIPNPEIGDTALTEDKNKLYYKSAAGWKTGLGYEFVPRSIDTPDKQIGDFTTDGNWKLNLLDLSGIVPAGAKAVMLKFTIADDAAGSEFLVRQNATSNMNAVTTKVFVANIACNGVQVIACDSDRLFDYLGSNVVFTTIDFSVVGWFI